MRTCARYPLGDAGLRTRLRPPLFTSCSLLCVLAGAPPIHAWGLPHLTITRGALNSLPQWERKLWKANSLPLSMKYCLYPDRQRDTKDAALKAQLGKYCILPDGKPIPHVSRGDERNAYVMRHYLGAIVAELKAERYTEAAKYAGAFAHYLEDSGCPVHVVDNTLILRLLPPPPEHEGIAIHDAVEIKAVPVSLGDRQPALLGSTVEEAVSVLRTRYRQMEDIAAAQVVPIVQAIYAGDEGKADAGRIAAATACAEVVADAWHTCFCIAFGRTE